MAIFLTTVFVELAFFIILVLLICLFIVSIIFCLPSFFSICVLMFSVVRFRPTFIAFFLFIFHMAESKKLYFFVFCILHMCNHCFAKFLFCLSISEIVYGVTKFAWYSSLLLFIYVLFVFIFLLTFLYYAVEILQVIHTSFVILTN